MQRSDVTLQRGCVLSLALLLASCGGGSGGSVALTRPATCGGGAALDVAADAAVSIGRVAGAVVIGCTGALSRVRWTQIAGTPVALLSAKTQAISFEPSVQDTYRFRVDALDRTGRAASQEVAIVATAAANAAGNTVTVRVDQALRTGQRASLRAWTSLAVGDAIASVTWTQLEGPAALDIDTTVPQRLLFTAPPVARDTVLRFRATLTTQGGAIDSDEAHVVVEALPPAPDGQLFRDATVDRVYPYRANAPFADRLVDCVFSPSLFFSNGATNLCRLSRLPLLASAAADGVPTVEAIMDRVLVSHDWMAEVFEQFLRTQDAHGDFRRMLGSVTAVVLGAHVRPSYYWSATGAIYLDAANLWLNAQQRDVIGEAPDFRIGFDRDLNFSGPWRYTVGNAEAQLDFPYDRRALTRDASYLLYELGPLLYHELAHANDFFPPGLRGGLDPNRLVYEAVPVVLPSDRLASSLPLASAEMFALARVKFFGVAASDTQRAYTPAQIGDFFRGDRASDEYSYSKRDGTANSREDLAMLFEEFMMSYRHGVRRDVGFTSKFQDGQTGSDLIVAWGQRGRVGEATIRPRVSQVLNEIAPWIDANAVATLPAPVQMRAGESWAANLSLLPPGTSSRMRQQAGEVSGARGRGIEGQLHRPYVIVSPPRQPR